MAFARTARMWRALVTKRGCFCFLETFVLLDAWWTHSLTEFQQRTSASVCSKKTKQQLDSPVARAVTYAAATAEAKNDNDNDNEAAVTTTVTYRCARAVCLRRPAPNSLQHANQLREELFTQHRPQTRTQSATQHTHTRTRHKIQLAARAPTHKRNIERTKQAQRAGA